MKLSEHVELLRTTIEKAFDKQFARLGFSKSQKLPADNIAEEQRSRRQGFELMLQNHVGETGDYVRAREKLMDELIFTLFNRLAAVKVMEAAKLFPPILTKQAEHGDRSFGHKAWLEINPHKRSDELEGIRDYIKQAFNMLGESLPLYSRGYAYALLPDTVSLNEIIDTINAVEQDNQVGSDIWESDDVLGWLYESYNNTRKKALKDSGDKIEFNYVSLQSQVYTPRWVVQFLVDNSLGKLYLEMYPDSKIKTQYKIANVPDTQTRAPKPLHEIKLIDPACGSGNFLLYAFDLFYDLYLDQIENYAAEYEENEVPRLIIEQNMSGIDLDDRAIQLAQLGLFIKAKKKQRSIGNLNFQVVSSDFYLPDYAEVSHIFEKNSAMGKRQRELIAGIWSDLQYAYKFGSLVRLTEKMKAHLHALLAARGGKQPQLFTNKELGVKPKLVQADAFIEQDIESEEIFIAEFFANLKAAVEQYAKAEGSTFLTSKTRDAITFLELLTTEYDVATANPPYTDSSDFGPELKKFIQGNYKKPYKFHTNLYATFIKRCYELTGDEGKVAMIHPRTFMFIKTFEDVRKFMIDKTHINVFVDYSLSNLFGTIMVDPAFYVFEKEVSKDKDAWFISLDQYTRTPNEKYKKDFCLQALSDYIAGKENPHNYTLPQEKLKIIKSWPFIYWISDEFRKKFGGDSFEEKCDVVVGLQTGDTSRFIRYWWEVGIENIATKVKKTVKWFPYVKGGTFNKWYGNNWTVINWFCDGIEIKDFRNDKGKQKSRPQNISFYFKQGATYTLNGSKGASFRFLDAETIFDVQSPSVFASNDDDILYMIATLNSNLAFYIIGCLNPTVNTTPGDIKRVPYVVPASQIKNDISSLALANIEIKRWLSQLSMIEINSSSSPMSYFSKQPDLKKRIKSHNDLENHLLTQVLINEAIINEKIFEVYELTEKDRAMVLAKEGESIGSLPVLPQARKEYLTAKHAKSAKENFASLVPFAVEKEFPLPPEVMDFINSLPTKEFTAEERQEIESGFATLYQSNNDLEEFCIRHQVNPINVWYWFKQSNVIPQQRMHTLAMEFLADMIREILMEDEDGIIPLVPNAGEKVLLDRIEDKFYEKGFSQAQFSSFDSVLGRSLPDYINNHFFKELSDHLNLFMYLPKTPFIWHLSSGVDQGFDAYIIIYKWSRDKLMRLRSVYIEHRERSLVNRQSDLAENDSAQAQNEKDRIFKQLREIESFKVKIDELLAEGYDPILDDGVGKNIAPLQQKKMIPYDVLNPGQLKKYLNADW